MRTARFLKNKAKRELKMFWKERILQTDKAQERAESGQISKK